MLVIINYKLSFLMDLTLQIVDFLTALIPKIVTLSAILAAFIPPQTGGTLGVIYNIINRLAFNFKHAVNKS